MTTIRILPYKQGSKSAKALADGLGGRVLRLEGSRFNRRPEDLIINWGSVSEEQEERHHPDLNRRSDIRRIASNKLCFFEHIRDAGFQNIIPEFWTNQEDIPDEVFDRDGSVVCRTILTGHSGQGIVIANNRDELVPSPLYVRYVKKQDEYRIHVGRGQRRDDQSLNRNFIVISQQRKARRRDVEEPNWKIRNLANGFVFVRTDINPPESVIQNAIEAVRIIGLDFGAVDVIWNEREQRAYVLEVNLAPGLEGQTVTDYVNFFQGII